MLKKNNSIKLIKYYNFINYNLIYNNKAINRYKNDKFKISSDKIKSLKYQDTMKDQLITAEEYLKIQRIRYFEEKNDGSIKSS